LIAVRVVCGGDGGGRGHRKASSGGNSWWKQRGWLWQHQCPWQKQGSAAERGVVDGQRDRGRRVLQHMRSSVVLPSSDSVVLPTPDSIVPPTPDSVARVVHP
jgi:hypothetical protein